MATTSTISVAIEDGEEQFVIPRVSWDAYLAFNDALGERSYPRMVFCAGRLTLMGKSRRHERLSRCLSYFVVGVAGALGLECEASGEATCRRREKEAGLEGDETFHFGANAVRMRGLRDYDFDVDPPPDLAVEVEVSHSADDAVEAWGRLGTTEIWRFDVRRYSCTFWNRSADGSYQQIARSSFLAGLEPADVVDQMRRVLEIGTTKWRVHLDDWVRGTLIPRQRKASPKRRKGGG